MTLGPTMRDFNHHTLRLWRKEKVITLQRFSQVAFVVQLTNVETEIPTFGHLREIQ